MLLRTRIVLIFAVAAVLLITVATAPFWVMEELANSSLAQAKQDAQRGAWNGAVADAVTPYEIATSRVATTPRRSMRCRRRTPQGQSTCWTSDVKMPG